MSLRSRLSISLTAAALLAAAVVTPAVADDDRDDEYRGDPGNYQEDWGDNQDDWNGPQEHHNPRYYKGRVTASSLALRSRPTRSSQVIRWADRGEILSIFCKTRGQTIQGNPVWYQIADDIWAWGAGRYIDNIGPSPRWC